jgi:hypothetical protein
VGARFQSREAARARQEQYRREDEYRLHQRRVDVYTAFCVDAGHMRALMASPDRSGDGRARAVGARNALFEAYTSVALIGGPEVWEAAGAIMEFTDGVVFGGQEFDFAEWPRLIMRIRAASRRDLIRDAA